MIGIFAPPRRRTTPPLSSPSCWPCCGCCGARRNRFRQCWWPSATTISSRPWGPTHLTKVLCLGVSSLRGRDRWRLVASGQQRDQPGRLWLPAGRPRAGVPEGGRRVAHPGRGGRRGIVQTLLGSSRSASGPPSVIFYGAAIVIRCSDAGRPDRPGPVLQQAAAQLGAAAKSQA